MKHIFKLMLLIMALVIAPMTAQADKTAKTDPNVERYNVSDNNGLLAFGKSYYEVDGRPVGANGNYYSTEHSNWSMKGWPNADTNKHVTTYIHFPTCSTNAKIQLTTTGAVTFVVKVYCMEDPSTEISSKTVNISTGTDQWITVMDTKTFSQKAWYKFDIQCTSGAANVGEFKYWQFSNSLSEPAYTADYMSSPSVHLNGWHTTDPTVPSAGRYDWTYQEVMIPEGDDIVGTYCMSLGVLHGYMGIQKDSETDYPIIFSMWDNGSTDNDPNLPDYLRSGALDAGEGVTIARFGGEGTGAQAKFRTSKNWEPGKWVKFLCNARPEIVDVEVDDPDHPGQKKTITYSNTLTSAWVWADGIDTDWRYIATIRQSGANNYMDGWYSFLEDYNWPSGQWKRNAYYRRGGLHSMVTGKWYNANNVGFGHTDGGNTYGDRDDYGHGKTIVDGEEAFYLTSGGYHENVTDTENTLTLITDFENKIGTPISQATLTTLLARVDQAIKKEQGTKLAEDFENSRETLAASGFTVVYVNSEATNEGDANKKEAAIDGNENTYWHSRWSGGSSTERNYPFYIDIQLSEEMQAKEIEQIAFVFRTGNKSYVPKKLQLQYSSNNSTWTSYSEVYNIADAATSTVNLTTKVTGKKYLRLYFAEGYSDCLAIKEIYFRTAVGRDALNEQVQAILDKENHFDGYSTSDLAALKTAYNNGNWTDAQTIKTALTNLAANGTLLKYGVVNGTNAISSFKAYQLYNANGLGDLVVENSAPAVKADADVNVTLDANNWQLLRSEKWNAYYLYNASAEKYLAFENSTAVLTDKPTPVYVGTRSSGGNFEGFTFQFDLANANSFLTANGTSATLGASNTDGAVWQLRDNYGITPAAVNVNELLAEADEEGAPEGFDGEGYTIRLNGTNLYLSTIEVDDKGKSTYSLSTYPEYFKVVSTGNKTYTLQSATSKKYVGYTGAPTSWDVVNHADNWTIADIEGGVTTIIKSGSQGLGANSNEQAAGRGVYTNKTDTHQWIFTYYEGSGEEPEDDGLIKMSTSTEKYYYTIRNNNNPGNYAHYAGASANLALNSTKNASAVFYFTPASDYSASNIAVNIHNVTAGNLVMNDWASWGSTPSLTWYISDATGTTGQTDDWNIRRTNSGNNYWNHQGVGVASWSAGGDRGSGWYLEPVTPIELDVQINGTDDTNAGVTYNGTLYKTGQHVTAFFASAGDFVPAEVSGMAATVTIYEGTAYVDYEVCDPFFSTSTTNANYHKIVFKNGGGNVAIDDALNTSSHIITASRTDATAWAFIGTIDNFVLCSQDGKYVKIADDRLAETETASEATTFKIVVNKEGGYYGITPSSGGNGFNCWSGIGTNHEIGFYGVNDSGSQLLFYDATGTEQEAPRLVEEEYTVTGATAFNKPSKHTLWYDQPAGTSYNNWMEYSLPIGNGELGGSIYGGVKTDKITLNEKSFWDGASVTRGNPNHGEYLKVGNVWVKNLSNAFDSGVKNYVRYLDIDNAVAGVQYADNDGTQYERVAFSSQPEKVMAVRYTATGTNKLHLNFTLEPGGQLTSLSSPAPAVAYRSNGSHAGNATFNGKLETLTYAAQVTVKADDNATVTSNYKGITVENATEITLYYTAGTDFDAFKQNSGFVNGRASQLPADMASRINSTSAKNWSSILDAHKADYKTYYDRVALDIKKSGASVNSTKTTKALVDYYGQSQANKDSNEGLFLEQLYYNYGRYLLISSNRGESVPNNLQGIWVDTDNGHAPWNSDIHTNINIQMNYWPAEPNNLSDLHKPLLDHIISIADAPGPKAQALAKNQTVGWVINTESNIFGGMSGFSNGYTIANAWYVTHLWQHYRYTLDKTFLRKAFPAMLGAAQYWAERLVKNTTDNLYECPGEWSPEQGPTENATAHSQQLVRELFDNTLAAIQELDAVNQGLVSSSVVTDIQNKRNNLDLGLRTEKYYSGSHNDKNWNSLIADGSDIIREWKTSDYTAGENQHRHTSHLMALYPFSQLSEDVTVGSTTYTADQLFTAAVNSLTQRGDNSTGWAMGWRVNLWARALNGNHARVLLNNALKHARSYGTDQSAGGVYYNLWDGHAPFQIDGNFGVCAGVSEMLLQSHTGVIQLLPALPDAWAEGSITGLKAVGNFQVDQQWAGGSLTKATIVNKHTAAQDLYVQYGTADLTAVKVTVNGVETTPVLVEGKGYKLSNVASEAKVEIIFSEEPEPTEAEPATSVVTTFHNEGNTWAGVQFTVNATDADGNAVQNVTASATSNSAPAGPENNVTSDMLRFNYQTSGGSETVTFTITGLPEGSTFDKISLPMYAINKSGAFQSSSASASEVNVVLNVAGGVTQDCQLTKTNFNITAHTGGELNEELVFLSPTPITTTGEPITVAFTFSKGTTNNGCYMAFHSLNLTTSEPPTVYPYTIRSKNNGKYAFFNADAKNGDDTVVTLVPEADATVFNLTSIDGKPDYYLMSCDAEGTTQYVYALNTNDADFNVCFTTDAAAATAWNVKYVVSEGGVDYYNIIPEGGSRSWNVRNNIGGVPAVGQWSAGNNNGSLWQFICKSPETITLTYTFTNSTIGDGTTTVTLPEGSFYPQTLPYGVSLADGSSLPKGVAKSSGSFTNAYTLSDSYPFKYSQSADNATWFTLKIRNTFDVGYQATSPNYPTVVGGTPAKFAFIGTPWGTKIVCQEGGTDKALGGTVTSDQAISSVAYADGQIFVFENNSNHFVFRADGHATAYVNAIDGSSKLGYWDNGSAATDAGSTFIFTEVSEEIYDAFLAKFSEALIGVYAHILGYPTEDAVTEIIEEKYGNYETFAGIFIEGLDATTYPTALATYNAILACPYIYLPEDGKAYYFTNVQQKSSAEKVMEGKEYILKFNTSTKELTTEEYIQDMAVTDQHYFICHHLGEGKYIFVNNYGYYLRHYANSHGGALSDSYDEDNDYIKVVKHATSGNTQPGIDAFFGLVALKGNRPNFSANASIVVNGNTGGFDACGDDYLVRYNAANNQFSTAFRIEEVAYPYNHPKLIKGDNGYYASIYLPFAMQVPEGIECYRGTEDRGNNLALEKMNADNTPVPAGGYILYTDQTYLDSDPESSTYGQELESIQELVTPADAAPEAVDNLFIGTTAEGDAGKLWEDELEGNNPYVLANKSKGIGFYRYTATSYPKGKAIYLAGGASTRERIGFQFDDIVEAIKAAKGEETYNTVFDLTGRRLEKAAKGVNIMGGKKVLK